MSRRHFMSHMAGASAMTMPALAMGETLRANADDLKRRRKSAILLWMGGGPSTMDIWDLKPGASTGGPFQPIATSGNAQISEHMPLMAKQMHNMAIIRSMSTREADHNRGRYYMHTGYVPNPNVEHPSYGAVLSNQLIDQRPELEIPPFVTVGGGSVGPGFLGMAWAPFSVSSTGQVRNLDMGLGDDRLYQRMYALDLIENGFINQRRGSAASDHQKILKKTLNLMTSEQMKSFKVASEPDSVKERYGNTGFGRGCLMARRLVEVGVPFIEVGLGGWDMHSNIHQTLSDTKLPELDQAMSALTEDLEQRGLLEDTAIIWMGEFSRTPRINGNAGRDHWARSWSVVVGGAGMNGGIAVGKTSADGTRVETDPYSSQDVMASVCNALGISLQTTFTSKSGRPMKIANSGKVIKELFS
ncbi:MAG: DUF1501 domain-containing protein [Planctomycetaceae bacterium]|nr:DUF1501 domain-containing protein [Planctomycetaceae bacterium]MBT4726000.1 DUF1501 domain-containing protein [Planctomycetaceae bacterium]MBT4846000.1 DUF1501 domain-containing protein [Planctomycetaceae bacterium]MBT5126153.1 DUF1501 domain-containing protein [Planctomycetaceae bacterium]MBT5600389.1 DUF1501 domain-containing protein [Planctomycetaceae bacterium]